MKKRIALLLLTSLCLVNTMPSFAASSAKVSVVGSSDVQANSISWSEGDILYMIMNINKKVTKEELTAMAKELIDLETDAVTGKIAG